MKTTPYTWLLFDADGTLFDYDECERRALTETFRQAGLPAEEGFLEAYRRINAGLWLEREQGRISVEALKLKRFAALFSEIGVPADPGEFSARYLDNLGGEAILLDQAAETIERLSQDYQLALVTNGLKEVQRRRLAKSPLDQLFKAVIISDEIGASKPAVAFFEETFNQIGRPDKSRVLMIGDSLTSDILGANNFGLAACWVNLKGERRPAQYKITYEINRLSGLMDILDI